MSDFTRQNGYSRADLLRLILKSSFLREEKANKLIQEKLFQVFIQSQVDQCDVFFKIEPIEGEMSFRVGLLQEG